MKKVLFLGCLVVFFQTRSSYAQQEINYYQLKKDFLEQYAKQIEKDKTANKEDGTLERFNRWAYFMENRIDESTGECFDPTLLWKEKHAYFTKHPKKHYRSNNSNWESLGPTSPFDANNPSFGALGRVNCLAVSPSDTNTLFVGTPDGGIWKSTNGGITWSTNTDELDNLSISAIRIDPTNTNIMYAATGDAFGLSGSSGFWGGTYSIGVLKSIDGGVTWNTTGLSWPVNGANIIRELTMNPDNPQELWAATQNGMMKTIDGGVTWTTVQTGSFFEAKFNPKNGQTVYSVGSALRKSTDGGLTWSLITPPYSTTTTGSTRNRLTVCYNDTNKLYFLHGKEGKEELFVSTNGGQTWVSLTNNLLASTYASYGYYGACIEVDPNNDNKLIVSGFNIVESINGGTNFYEIQNGNIHVDHHHIQYNKPQNGVCYISTDGGLYKKRNFGVTMISEGLVISQMYRIALNPHNHNTFYTGLQDNGNKRKRSNQWYSVTGADGMENLVDHTDTFHTIHSIQYGALYESYDGGDQTIPLNNAESPVWLLPLLQEETPPYGIYQGNLHGLLSVPDGIPITIANNFTMEIVECSRKFPKRWITSNKKKVWGTFGGVNGTWKEITGNLVGTPGSILDIAASNTDSNTVYACYGGFAAGKKVFKTTNNGVTWTNISGSLPNLPCNTIICGLDSMETVYVGTDMGVFYRDKFMTDWEAYDKNLPNVIIQDLRVANDADYIYAATYGRGAWRSKTQWPRAVAPVGVSNTTKNEINISPNPANTRIHITTSNKIQAVTVTNQIGQVVYQQNPTSNALSIDVSAWGNGIYIVNLQTEGAIIKEKILIAH